jgi:hypothetical protein
MADALQPAHPDGIAGEQVLVLVDLLRHDLQEIAAPAVEVQRRLQREPPMRK